MLFLYISDKINKRRLKDENHLFFVERFINQNKAGWTEADFRWAGAREGTGGGGCPTSPRIRDLYSKNFENSQNIFFFLVLDPP